MFKNKNRCVELFCHVFNPGGNEESELYELQTAREWSDDEEEGADGDPDDDEGLASSSPSAWGTPRQNSYELTFSYIAIAEAEAVASRHLRERRRGGSRSSHTPLFRTDTLETLLDSPDVDWDPQVFLMQEEQEEGSERRARVTYQTRTNVEGTALEREQDGLTESITTQSPQNPETQERETRVQSDETSRTQTVQLSSPSLCTPQQSPSHTCQGEMKTFTLAWGSYTKSGLSRNPFPDSRWFIYYSVIVLSYNGSIYTNKDYES